jgi:Fur family transcriptional regulator, peroxide stress response regulator
MNEIQTLQRETKYCKAIALQLKKLGHASNSELLTELRLIFPNVSATTVHRATARLAKRNAIALAPHSKDGSLRYDTNTQPHDHFMCTVCGVIKDANVVDKIIPILEDTIKDCRISGRLTLSGVCKKCS